MMKLNGVLPEKAEDLMKVFPDISCTEPDFDDGLVDVYVPSVLEIAINYNQVTKLLSLVAWDDAEKQVVLSDDDFVRFAIV